jgi:hypothetical protein
MKSKAARSLRKGEQALLLPGPTRAEPWELWTLAADGAECVQSYASPLDNRLRAATTLALPVAQVFCLPLWLNETDPKQLAGMIPLQLELRGLQPRAQEPAIFDWTVVAREESRTLVVAGVLPSSLAAEVQAEGYRAFDLSIRHFPLPENALVVWREQDRLAVAMTRDGHLAYFQALAENQISEGMVQDLKCIRATLLMQGVLGSLRQVVVWDEENSAGFALLRDALQLPVHFAAKPAPQRADPSWGLVPSSVVRSRKNRETRRWQLRGALIALVGWMLAQFVITSSRVNELQQWQTAHDPALNQIHDTRAAWNDLRPVVDEKSYPLELLLHAASAIPTEQLHLTLFEANNGHLLVKGESKDVAGAFQFLDQLKKDPYFASYTWSMAQPHLLPNDLAQFQVEGTRNPGDF